VGRIILQSGAPQDRRRSRYITHLPSDYFDKHRIFDRPPLHTGPDDRGDNALSQWPGGTGLCSTARRRCAGPEAEVLLQVRVRIPILPVVVSAEPHVGFSVWPAFLQRGDPQNPTAADYLYSGAYEAYGYVDGGGVQTRQRRRKRPVTGSTVDLYPGLIDANVPDITLSKDGEFTIDIAEKCASLVGTGFGITNFWDYVGDQLLMYLEFGTFDIQSALRKRDR